MAKFITRILIGALILALLPMVAVPKVFKSIDADGNAVYTDKQAPNSEQITLPEISSVKMHLPKTKVHHPKLAKPPKNEPEFGYQQLAIVAPRSEETIQNTGYLLNLAIDVQPVLRDEHTLAILLDHVVVRLWTADAAPKPPPGEAAVGGVIQIVIPNVWRGEHTIQVQLLDGEDNMLIASNEVVFFMKQATAILP